MMTEQFIEFKGKKYEVKEPTIKMWSDAMKLKNILTVEELNLKILSYMVGIGENDLLDIDAKEIQKISSVIQSLLFKENKNVQFNISLNGINYEMIDFYKMSFGQFVDIDTFLSKDELYRTANLNELASYLYIQQGKKYSEIDFKKQSEEFKELPIKYIEGAVFFLMNLGVGLVHLTELYSNHKFLWMIMKLRIRLASIGDGTQQLVYWPKTIFGKLIQLLLSPLYLVSITLRLLWTKIKKEKNK